MKSRVRLSFYFLFLYGSIINSHAFTFISSNDSNMRGWNTASIAVHVNYTDCPGGEEKLKVIIDEATHPWNEVPTSSLHIERGNETTTGLSQAIANRAPDVPLILCDRNLTNTIGSNADTIAAVSTVSIVNGNIAYAYILLNAENGKSANFANLEDKQKPVVLAHEMGHVLGLGHSGEVTALMYYSASEKKELRLSQDDMDGISFLYPRDEIAQGGIFGCGTLSSSVASYKGFTFNSLTALWTIAFLAVMLRQLRARFYFGRKLLKTSQLSEHA